MQFPIFRAEVRSILTATSGFIAQAGFTHSLSPARNCTFGCTYCYVPTMGIYGGLKLEDWRNWGCFTTFKTNAADLLRKSLRSDQIIYCSPLVDPYQPAEAHECMMPQILDVLLERPPRIFVIQTRGPLVLRDLPRLEALSRRTSLRVSFSITTDSEAVRKVYEPHCASIGERFETLRRLRAAGIDTFATLAPILPCNPETLVQMAVAATDGDIIADPFHVRAVKRSGATTREAALSISARRGWPEWHDPEFQEQVVDTMKRHAAAAGRRFGVGTEAFGWLAQ